MISYIVQTLIVCIAIYAYEWKNFRSANNLTKWAFSLLIAGSAFLWIYMRVNPLLPRLGHLFKYIPF
ncbi:MULTISPECIES: hypothetical protein [Bacillus]|jgi:hypothetical protein|uniref:Uncharacterized protein YfkS n=4 Tax=Bacillus subtilis group TaxID=653685 RepID=YFKS_BACSU|nr:MULTISPECIES: hypothetical protein [Bacillales]NP_388658.1 putative spore germination D protein [Bacillus subtilis subsp. subtilis str. 168]O35036.1 RecName: Full=Uncharacterized protein YfkS [Bacillus subtilis subsp. subtilis str. 168]AOL32563.1 hypothetical protein BGM20_19060 [Alkalicoccobacillus gibsonii]AXC52067.1 hypothetical protein DQ231_04100 [Bacillus spizizenii]MBW4823041.1 hypothetical protein [Bacillaceae bacterium]MDP4100351.1 hypothetical protein [Bacillota bacterium]MUG031